jgi:peptidyl-dipeptidase Dcp
LGGTDLFFSMTATPNPLLLPFTGPHATAPFDQIRPAHFLPALHEALAQGRAEIAAIVTQPDPATFLNTVVALERSGALLNRVSGVMHNLNGAETSPALQAVVREASPLETEYGNDILLNDSLFARVKAVYDQRDALGLTAEDGMLLEKTYKQFARNGAGLDAEAKDRLRAIDRALAEAALAFGENNLNETNEYLLVVTDEKDLAGLPDFVRDSARATALERGGADAVGWAFTLQGPSYGPFMQYADNRAGRETLYRAYAGRGFGGDKNDNTAFVEQLVALRHERANLLGYATHADFVLEERMAESATNVRVFLSDLATRARPVAETQLADLTAYARRHGFADDRLQAWDYSYYAEKLKRDRYALDDAMLKPYFRLDTVIEGAFAVANRLYGLTFREVKTIPVWHPDVQTFEVLDADGSLLAVFYGDYFPRPGKRAGAWMSQVQGQRRDEEGHNLRPHVLNVCNFTRPVVDSTGAGETGAEVTPSLLTFYEVTTLFHEFGHGLHGMLANGQYESLTGTSVSWDFVELPSQVMENWCYEPDALRLFARHYQTNELIPNELIDRIRASQQFLAGIATLRQVRFGLADLYWHDKAPTGESIADVEARIDAQTNLFPPVSGTAFSPAFGHIFAGGYSAGYYSYKWSEVLDADAFEFFAETGGLQATETARRFRQHVLAAGGSEKPMVLYRKFRGREPAPTAMLRRSGLLA